MTSKKSLHFDFECHFCKIKAHSDFAKVFTHFARIFTKSKVLGVHLHSPPTPVVASIEPTCDAHKTLFSLNKRLSSKQSSAILKSNVCCDLRAGKLDASVLRLRCFR